MKAEKPYVIFGQALKNFRKKKKLSQAKVGKLVGMDRTSIANIEGGKQRIMLEEAFKLAWLLGFSLDQVNAQIASNDLQVRIAQQPQPIKNVIEKILADVKVKE